MNVRAEEWIYNLEPETRNTMLKVRELILQAHPMIIEKYSYKIPFYYLNGMLCYFAILKKGKRPVLGLCDGHLIPDTYHLLRADENQKYIRHILLNIENLKPEIVLHYIQKALDIKLNKYE